MNPKKRIIHKYYESETRGSMQRARDQDKEQNKKCKITEKSNVEELAYRLHMNKGVNESLRPALRVLLDFIRVHTPQDSDF